jgi:hypothetical protein
MSIVDMFKNFLDNLKVDNSEQITNRYKGITCCLNKNIEILIQKSLIGYKLVSMVEAQQ